MTTAPTPPQVGPTRLAKFLIFLIIVGAVGGAAWFFRGTLFPSGKGPGGIDLGKFKQATGQTESTGPEAFDPSGITTVAEYKYVPQERLPPVKGVSAYKWDADQKVVQFPINVWIGWLPIVAANGGFAPNPESIFAKKYGFQVNLKLIDDPVVARDAYAAGESHILWGTLDMMVLFAPELMRDSRTAPRIFQQVDWSNGGDGIVVRDSIRSVKDLEGKSIVYAQNSPSQYFVNNLLLNAGIQPDQVKHKFTATAFEAAAAFVADSSLAGCVSWAPDIYTIPEKVKGTRILTTTAEANKLIADVWAARADFAKDHPEVIKGLVAGIFEGMDRLKNPTEQARALQWMAEGYGMQVGDVQGMINDAHSTNFAENKEFFLNQNNPANFERTWKNVSFVYKELGVLGTPVRFDEVMDFSILQAVEKEGLFKHQTDEFVTKFVPSSFSKVQAEAPILTQVIRIGFFPNSSNLYEPQHDSFGAAVVNTLYDPNVEATLERVARLSGQYERAVISISGHTDSSMKGKVPYQAVKDLSQARADAVRKALVSKYKFDPNKFSVEGKAWDLPADPAQPENQALNRRVEIAVYPVESGG
jgi:NitT/TauT family transport system substrate-binding protein